MPASGSKPGRSRYASSHRWAPTISGRGGEPLDVVDGHRHIEHRRRPLQEADHRGRPGSGVGQRGRPRCRRRARCVRAPLEDEDLASREERERSLLALGAHPHRRQHGLHGVAAESVDQQIGGGVVADLDHLLGRFAHGHGCAGGAILQLTRWQALQLVGDRQLVVPTDLTDLDRLHERAEHVQLECRAEWHRFARPGGANRRAAHRRRRPRRRGT